MADFMKAVRTPRSSRIRRVLVEVKRKRIALFNVNRQLFALYTRPHRGGPLADGYWAGSELSLTRHIRRRTGGVVGRRLSEQLCDTAFA